jgi:hypothetical protein
MSASVFGKAAANSFFVAIMVFVAGEDESVR